MNTALALCSLCLVAGGLLLVAHAVSLRRPSLAVRLARARGEHPENNHDSPFDAAPVLLRELAQWVSGFYAVLLRRAGSKETIRQLFARKLLFAFAVPFIPLAPYAAASRHAPAVGVVLALALAGSLVPDLMLRSDISSRREAIALDLPEAVSIMALAMRAGQSLRQALQIAARDCQGPLGQELSRALTLARRDRNLGEREALLVTARDTGEPVFMRFTELLAAKESPYLEFLRGQARQMRVEQNRSLERAADRAYIKMHAPLAPLLAVLVLLIAYGFIHYLTTV